MELPKIELPEPLEAPKKILDEEDQEDLFCDCYLFLQRVLERSNPQWMQNEGLKLKLRLEETLSWHKMQ